MYRSYTIISDFVLLYIVTDFFFFVSIISYQIILNDFKWLLGCWYTEDHSKLHKAVWGYFHPHIMLWIEHT